jgi:hypothetical protein
MSYNENLDWYGKEMSDPATQAPRMQISLDVIEDDFVNISTSSYDKYRARESKGYEESE